MNTLGRRDRLAILKLIRVYRSGSNGSKLVSNSMPSKACIQLHKVTAPRVVPNGASVAKSEDGSEWIVKDGADKTVGTFKVDAVSGWWLENVPMVLENLTEEDLNSLHLSTAEGIPPEKVEEIEAEAKFQTESR